MFTYQEAQEKLGNRNSRKLENNTYLEKRDNGTYAIRLHKTDVVTIGPDSFKLNSGGWRTVTTKDRINKYSPVSIRQSNRIWTIGGVQFNDGISIVLSDDGWKPEGNKVNEKAVKADKRKAKKYVDGFVDALVTGKVPPPSRGDCWGCLMVTDDGRAPMGGRVHVESHFKDKYYVPSMLVRACERFGASQYTKGLIGSAWRKEPLSEWDAELIRRNVTRLLYRWIMAELGYAS